MSELYEVQAKKIKVGDIVYDSHLEYKYQVLFDQLGIRAIPHPVTFKTGKYWSNGEEICYTPDFYLCDLNKYAEVKPKDEMLRAAKLQQKISAAMDHNTTPVGHGLIILGDMTGFTPDKRKGAKKVFLWGEYYEWWSESIVRSRWGLGADDEGAEVRFVFEEDANAKFDDFPHYPRFSKNPSAELGRAYNHQHASEILWLALGAAMHAVQNLEKNNTGNEKGD